MRYLIALFAALILNAAANLLLKVGMKSIDASGGLLKGGLVGGVRAVSSNATLLIGLLLFVLNAFFYMYALQSRALKISLAYPIMVGGGFAVIAVAARLHPALSERLTWGQLSGVALVMIGVVLIAVQADATGS